MLTNASKAGNAVAQNNLGVFYLEGLDGFKDEFMAIKWFTESAKNKYQPAMLILGMLYLQGVGVEQNQEKG